MSVFPYHSRALLRELPQRLRRATTCQTVTLLLLAGQFVGCTTSKQPADATSKAPPGNRQAGQPPLTPEQARAHLMQAVTDAPDDPLALLELALFDRQVNNLPLAEQELIACWKQFPTFSRAPYHLGMLYFAQGRDALALPPLRTAAVLDPKDALTRLGAGLACERLGMKEEARRYVQEAIRLDAQRAEPYLLLARLNDQHGTSQQALAALDRYLERSADPASGYFLKGRIYARLSDGVNAESWLKRAIEANPNSADFWTTLGRVYTELLKDTRTEEGLQCFQKALELDPKNADTHRYYGLTLKRLKRYEEAIPHLQQALSSGDNIGPIYYDLGQTLIQAGRAEEGKEALAKYQQYREYTEGVMRLNRALAVAPKDRERHYALIRFCLKYRQYGPAANALENAVKTLGPDETLRSFMTEIENARQAAGLSK